MIDTHWRNSMKPARFFFMDARAALPFLLMLLHFRWYTIVFCFSMTLVFYLLEQRGYGFWAALRAGRVWLVTRKRPAIKTSNLTRSVDYGFEKIEVFEALRAKRGEKDPDTGGFSLKALFTPGMRPAAVKKAAVPKQTVRPAPRSVAAGAPPAAKANRKAPDQGGPNQPSPNQPPPNQPRGGGAPRAASTPTALKKN